MFASKELAPACTFLDLIDDGIQAFAGDSCDVILMLELWIGLAFEATLQRSTDGVEARVVFGKNRDGL